MGSQGQKKRTKTAVVHSQPAHGALLTQAEEGKQRARFSLSPPHSLLSLRDFYS